MLRFLPYSKVVMSFQFSILRFPLHFLQKTQSTKEVVCYSIRLLLVHNVHKAMWLPMDESGKSIRKSKCLNTKSYVDMHLYNSYAYACLRL